MTLIYEVEHTLTGTEPSRVSSWEINKESVIDQDAVPPGFFAEGLIPKLNALIDLLRDLRVNKIAFEIQGHTRLEQMIRAHNQAYLWRCVELIETSALLVRSGHGFGAMLLVPSIYETVAAFISFEECAIPLLHTGNEEALVRLVYGSNVHSRGNRDGSGLPCKLMLEHLGRLDKLYDTTIDHHSYLSEFRSPDPAGVYLWFTMDDGLRDQIVFSKAGADPGEPITWVVRAAYLLNLFYDAYSRVEAELERRTFRKDQT